MVRWSLSDSESDDDGDVGPPGSKTMGPDPTVTQVDPCSVNLTIQTGDCVVVTCAEHEDNNKIGFGLAVTLWRRTKHGRSTLALWFHAGWDCRHVTAA